MSAKGHICRRPSGSWAVVIPVPQRDGTKKPRWFTCRTKAEAERLRARLVHELTQGTYLDASTVPLAEFLEEWIGSLAAKGRRPSTEKTYRTALRCHLGPALGHIPLSKLSPREVERYYAAALSSGLSPSTVRLHDCLLRAALRQAVRWELLARSPMEAVEAPRPGPRVGRALGDGELRRLLAALAGTPLELPALLALFCQLRRGEVLALTWADVDLDRALLQVRASKTPAGIRAIALPPLVARALTALPHRAGPVVLRADGKPWRATQLSGAFAAAARDAGLGRLRFHDCKHTGCTALLQGGVPLKTVSRRAGHASTTVTLNVYGHVLEEHDQAAAAWIEERFGDGAAAQQRTG